MALSQYLRFDLGAAVHYTAMVGNGFVETGQPEAGLRYCDIVLRASRLVRDLGFPFLAYQGKARALFALHRDRDAHAVLDSAVKRAREEHNHFALAQLLIVRGTGAASTNSDEAIDALKEAYAISERRGFEHVFAWSAFELASVYRQVEDLDAAERLASRTIEFMRKLDDVYHLPQHLALLASLETKKGDFHRADELYREATDVMNALLVNVVRRQLKSSLIATLSNAYIEHFALAADKFRDIGKAYEIIEEARGRALADTLHGESETLAASSDEITIAANQEITRIQLALMHESDQTARESLLDQLFGAEQLLAPEPKVNNDRISRFGHRKPVPLHVIQASLGGDEMVLEYVLGESQSYCLRITRSGAAVVVIPSGRKAIEKLVDDYLAGIRSRRMEIAAEKELYKLLLQSVIGRESTGRLIIVPDGKLNLLPFDALKNTKNQYVLESRVVTYAPSATVLALLRQSPSHRARSVKPAFLGIGDVLYAQPKSIAKAGVVTVAANSPSDFFDHGAVTAECGSRGAFCMRQRQRKAARGRRNRQPGARLPTGARSVLASLWTADDTYTVGLMKRFYEHLMNGIDNGAALRKAKLDLLHKFSNQALPFYWAGFTLTGDGQIGLSK